MQVFIFSANVTRILFYQFLVFTAIYTTFLDTVGVYAKCNVPVFSGTTNERFWFLNLVLDTTLNLEIIQDLRKMVTSGVLLTVNCFELNGNA